MVMSPPTVTVGKVMNCLRVLSKRTLSYVGFVQTANDTNAAYNFNINPYTVAKDANATALVVGLVHFF
jgi:hypothetical protein